MIAISTRRAESGDCEDIFIWRNDPITRAMSLTQDAVNWGDHVRWFEATVQNPDRILVMCSVVGSAEKGGVVRFDVAGTSAIISINIAPTLRGKKLASRFLEEAIRFVSVEKTGLSEIIAEIRSNNIASRKAFEKAGFELVEINNNILRFRISI